MDAYVDPDRERFQSFKRLPLDEPVHMLNLVALHERAVYPDGSGTSGRLAYRAYGEESGPVFRRVGGRILWSGEPRFTVIGPPEEAWDIAFIAAYPSASAFLDMLRDPLYRRAVRHRQAAVRTSRLIRMLPRESGEAFGG